MKRVLHRLIECYTYNSYDEFESHYKEMIAKGFRVNSESSKPEWCCKNLDSYFTTYYKEETLQKTVVELITTACEDICDNYCEYRHTVDDESLCDILRSGKPCPLDRLQ